ncbi:MAG: AMP-binding protein [Candidatus Competibacteraceae bacterium]|nr:AMP-binding protein [Candidatus Competibacteraceae bacterium]
MLSNLLRRVAQRSPQAVAITFGETAHTYRELDDLANRLAGSLMDLGLAKGDWVALYLYNCPETVVCYHACFKGRRAGRDPPSAVIKPSEGGLRARR